MMNSEEILEMLRNCPQGYIKPDHTLFTLSNTSLLHTYKKLGAINNEIDVTIKDTVDSTNQIYCNVFGCSTVFDNTYSYQSHYNAMHRFICLECKKSLPTEHLLDLHITEHHDSYFNARIERGERLFKCYLQECKEVFENSHQRKEHCIKQHKFPTNFRFDKLHKNFQQKGKICRKNFESVEMDIDEELELKSFKNKKLKMISFGHQRDRTFCSKNGQTQKQDNRKTLEDMNTLKHALESM